MKKVTKPLITILFYTIISLSFCVLLSMQNNVVYASHQPAGVSNEAYNKSASPRSEIIDWRYKYFDGILYKRLYNYSTGKWVGNWIKA